MVEIYAELVKNKVKTIDEVPKELRIAVKQALGMDVTDAEKLNAVIAQKLSEVSSVCGQIICNGFDVDLSSGTHHFSLTAEDQANINSIFNAVILGASEYPYHADGEPCTVFSASDIVKLYITTKTFITNATTYNNMLRLWIKRETNIDVLKTIAYGSDLPDDLKVQMQEILNSANNQIQSIVSKMGNT